MDALFLMTVDQHLQPKPLAVAELLEQVRSAAAEGAAAGYREAAAAAPADPDEWLDAKAAARHIYGRDGQVNAYRQLRRRYPALDACSSGARSRRRWRRRDLDAWVTDHPQVVKLARRGSGT